MTEIGEGKWLEGVVLKHAVNLLAQLLLGRMEGDHEYGLPADQ